MTDLALGHSTMYVTMRNLIQYMGDMALMQKKSENRQFLVIFKMIFGTFGAQIGPHILLQTPYK